jgi:hypothetical protein
MCSKSFCNVWVACLNITKMQQRAKNIWWSIVVFKN